MLEGRGFSLYELKKALLAAAGHKLTTAYLTCWDLDVWELVEALEALAELQAPEDDLWSALNV